MTDSGARANLLSMNVAESRSERAGRLFNTARVGLAMTLGGRGESRPSTSRRLEWLLTAAAVLGVIVIGLSVAVLVGRQVGGHGSARGALFVGLLLVAARFRLAVWRLGLLAALALSYFGSTNTAGTVEFLALVALFCIAATVSPRIVLWWMCVLMLAVLWIAMPLGVGNAIGMSGLIIAAAVAMDAIRGWQQTREALEVETEHAEREQARRAVLEERARIGRELHDVVAHHMSLIAVQAETAPYRVGEIPESVSGEFTAISAAARTALAEMRRLLGVLRNDEEAARAPQPQIEQIDDMIATARNAGMAVDYTPTDALDSIPQSIGLCAYRIVQEALTNASRHAPGAEVTVELVRNDDGLRVEVVNGPGRLAIPAGGQGGPAPGQGLTGMRERASLLGGALTAGATTDGGFAVTAVIPFE